MRNMCASGQARASRPVEKLGLALLAFLPALVAAQDPGSSLVLEPTRVIEFTTNEGTWMSADVSPDGVSVVFDLLGDLYVLPIEGGEANLLTRGMAWDTQPRYSPDGSTIAFISDRDGTDNIWVMNADGSDARAITRSKEQMYGSPSWSPDGRYLVARRWGAYPRNWASRKIELWMFHIDGGSGIQVTKGEGEATVAASPSFSPDGKYIYFSSSAVRFSYNAPPGRFQVRRLDRDTGELETLTALYGGGLSPRITPDGKYLVYATRYDANTGLRARNLQTREERWLAYPITRDNQEGFVIEDLLPGYGFTPDSKEVVLTMGGKLRRLRIEDEAGEPDVRAVNFTATVRQELAPLVSFPVSVGDAELQVRQLRWMRLSPDGAQIVFSAIGNLWVADLPGGSPRRLTDAEHREYMPAYSPDGQWIVYVSWSDSEGGQIWKIPASGGTPVALGESAGYYANPSFSPDGESVSFVMGSARGWLSEDSSDIKEIRTISVEGGASTMVTTAPGAWVAPKFSADGERIYYLETGSYRPGDSFPPSTVISIRTDGVDKRRHATIKGYGVEVAVSPDGTQVLFTHQGNVFLAAVPRATGEPVAITPTAADVPVWQVTREGGGNVAWADNGQTITWSFAGTFSSLAAEEFRNRRPEASGEGGDAAEQEAAETGRSSAVPRPESFTVELRVPRARPEGMVVLRGARLVTLVDDQVIEPGTVVIEGDRIIEVGPTNRVDIPRGATVIDVSGKTIVPGFVDAHAHMSANPDVFPDRVWPYAANLAYGVTATRDPSNANNQVFAYAEMVEAGAIIGPRITSTGAAMTTWEATIESYEDALALARRYKAQGATFLKEYLQPRRIQRQWLAQAAREVGISITAEGGGELKQDLSMVLDGYTGFEHSLPVVPIYRDVIELIARAGTAYTPTLVVAFGGPDGQNHYRQRYDIHADEKLRRFTPHDRVDRLARRRSLVLEDDYHFPLVAKGAVDIMRAGGTIMIGAHGEQQGLGYHWELWAMAEGGLTPFEAMVVAARMGAEGIGVGEDLGTIAPGKLADLIVLNRNPLADLSTTVDIRYVVKNGAVYDAETLDQVWPQQVPFPPFFWHNDIPRR